MNFEELLDYLDLEEAGQFEYFEALADLVECEEPIEMEAIYKLFEGADKETVATLLEDYFEDILDGLPENAGEIYSLLHQIKLSLVGMVTNIEDENDLRKFSDEIYKFLNWYSHESEVELSPENGGGDMWCVLRDAITASRLEKLGGEQIIDTTSSPHWTIPWTATRCLLQIWLLMKTRMPTTEPSCSRRTTGESGS